MTYLTDYTHESPSVDQLITEQAMDNTRHTRSDADIELLRRVRAIKRNPDALLFSESRCPQCQTAIPFYAPERCPQCGRHQ